MSVNGHEPVMTREVVQALNVQTDGTYVDATFGRGGHTRAILSYLGPAGRVLAIDRDPEAHRCAKQSAKDCALCVAPTSMRVSAAAIACRSIRA